ncbi:MAG: lipocalin family protein [Pyrinomonadaceae bacterium]|nr:lipocalin family protein [Pyrinomonadaceae bacterium]
MSISMTSFIFAFSETDSDDQSKTPVTTVKSVNLERYAGKWFEIARYPNRFQKKCAANVTATYVLNGDSKVDVINECLKKDGKASKAKGKAKVADKSTNAKLKVRFAPGWLSWLPFVWGDYWILELDEEYKYAVIGDPDRKYLWILSRESELDDSTYQKLLKKVEVMGFDSKKLVKTPQNG